MRKEVIKMLKYYIMLIWSLSFLGGFITGQSLLFQEIIMWPYTEEENEYISEQKQSKSDWDYDTYGHGA